MIPWARSEGCIKCDSVIIINACRCRRYGIDFQFWWSDFPLSCLIVTTSFRLSARWGSLTNLGLMHVDWSHKPLRHLFKIQIFDLVGDNEGSAFKDYPLQHYIQPRNEKVIHILHLERMYLIETLEKLSLAIQWKRMSTNSSQGPQQYSPARDDWNANQLPQDPSTQTNWCHPGLPLPRSETHTHTSRTQDGSQHYVWSQVATRIKGPQWH